MTACQFSVSYSVTLGAWVCTMKRLEKIFWNFSFPALYVNWAIHSFIMVPVTAFPPLFPVKLCFEHLLYQLNKFKKIKNKANGCLHHPPGVPRQNTWKTLLSTSCFFLNASITFSWSSHLRYDVCEISGKLLWESIIKELEIINTHIILLTYFPVIFLFSPIIPLIKIF